MDGYALAAGGILVQVPAEEAEEAREIVKMRDEPQVDEPQSDTETG